MRKWILLFKTILRFASKPSRSYFSVVEEVYKTELTKRPNDPYLVWFLGNIYVRHKKYKEAEILLESLFHNGLVNNPLVLLLSKTYFNLGQYKKVAQLLKGSERLSDRDIENYYLGYSLIELGEIGEAIKYFKIYLEHHPKDYKVFAMLGSQYYKEKLYDLALDAYRKAERLNPSKIEIKDSINLCIEMVGKSSEGTIH